MSEALQVIQPDGLLERAISAGASAEVLEKLMALKERWDQNQAKRGFDAAMAALRTHLPEIVKSQTVDFTSNRGRTHYRYESLSDVVEALTPEMAKEGLSFRWRTAQADPRSVSVTCIIAHSLGHREECTLSSVLDEAGNKNPIQSLGSAVCYLQRYTLKSAVGVAAAVDDDGNSAGKSVSSTEDKPVRSHTTLETKVSNIVSQQTNRPTLATEKTRERMLVHITKFPYQTLELFAASKGYIALGRPVTEWKLENVPTSREALDELILEIENFVRAEENRGEEVERARAEESKEFSEPFWNVKITLPRRGMKRSDYRREEGAHMDTIKSLYTGSAEDKQRLFGIVGEWHPSDWTDSDGKLRPPSDEDLECRKALDTFSEWHKNK